MNFIVGVTVSVKETLSVSEGEEIFQICSTLSAVEYTERNLTVTLTTRDGYDDRHRE